MMMETEGAVVPPPPRFDHLPDELVEMVLRQAGWALPYPPSLVRLVCRRWRRIADPIQRQWVSSPDDDIADQAERGHRNVVRWMMSMGCPWSTKASAFTAWAGKLAVLQLAREQGAPWDFRTCRAAAMGGHLHVLRWARENGCPWDKKVCAAAALEGHLDVLKWARENGAEWDSSVCRHAARGGHLALLVWAKDNGAPWDRDGCLIEASEPNTLRWIEATKSEARDPSVGYRLASTYM